MPTSAATPTRSSSRSRILHDRQRRIRERQLERVGVEAFRAAYKGAVASNPCLAPSPKEYLAGAHLGRLPLVRAPWPSRYDTLRMPECHKSTSGVSLNSPRRATPSPSTLRGCRMAKKVPLHTLAEMIGHDKLEMTMLYTKASRSDLKSAIEEIARP